MNMSPSERTKAEYVDRAIKTWLGAKSINPGNVVTVCREHEHRITYALQATDDPSEPPVMVTLHKFLSNLAASTIGVDDVSAVIDDPAFNLFARTVDYKGIHGKIRIRRHRGAQSGPEGFVVIDGNVYDADVAGQMLRDGFIRYNDGDTNQDAWLLLL